MCFTINVVYNFLVKLEQISYSFRACVIKWNYNVELSGIIFSRACIYKRINKEQWYRGAPWKVHTAWDLITTLRRLRWAKRVCKNSWIYEGFYDDVNRKVPTGPQKRSLGAPYSLAVYQPPGLSKYRTAKFNRERDINMRKAPFGEPSSYLTSKRIIPFAKHGETIVPEAVRLR